jgi:hypothetical protein
MARLTKVDPPIPEEKKPIYTIQTISHTSEENLLPRAYASLADISTFLIGEGVIKHHDSIWSELHFLINDTHRRDYIRKP